MGPPKFKRLIRAALAVPPRTVRIASLIRARAAVETGQEGMSGNGHRYNAKSSAVRGCYRHELQSSTNRGIVAMTRPRTKAQAKPGIHDAGTVPVDLVVDQVGGGPSTCELRLHRSVHA